MELYSWLGYIILLILSIIVLYLLQPKQKEKMYHFRSQGESLCIEIVEELLKRKVQTNLRHPLLINPETNRRLELDIYDSELNMGIEYNGEQHYIYPNCFHKTKKAFDKQLYRDQLKRKLCFKYGITLIEVPYTVDSKFNSLKLRKQALRTYLYKEINNKFLLLNV